MRHRFHKSGFLCKHYKIIITVLLINLMFFSLPLFAAPAKPILLTESQAIQLFYQRNLNLLAARYNIDQAQAQEIIASAIPNPTISVQISEISKNPNINSAALGCTKGHNVSCGPAETYAFSQLIEMAGKRGLRMQSSVIATQAAESDFRDALRILTNIVRDAYFGLLQAQKNHWLAKEIVTHYQDIVRDNRLRLQAGDIRGPDFLRINMESLRAQVDLDNAEAAIEQAQGNLAVVLNWPDITMQLAAEDKWPEIREIGQSLAREALIEKALSFRPDLQGDQLRANQADKDLILANRLKYPDVTLSAGFARDPSNTVLNTGFVGVSIPVPLFYQYKGEVNKASVNLGQMHLAVEETKLAVRNDIVASLAAWKSADKVVRLYEKELVQQARQVRDRTELAYTKGIISVLEFIDAQRSYKSVMLDYHTAMINRVNAYYDLAKSIGVEPNADLSLPMEKTVRSKPSIGKK